MKRLLLASLLVSFSLAYGCNKGTESTTQAAREPRMTDSDLKDKVETRIKSDAELRDADLSVSADAEKNWVTLSGTVPTEGMRTRAVEMARAAHAGLTVDDKIDVKHKELTRAEYTPEMARTEVENARAHKETVGGGIDDAWIHAKIVAKLLTDKDTPERKINVDVDHNVVTLRGNVDTVEAKTEAERLAKETDGVKRVNNMLKVTKS